MNRFALAFSMMALVAFAFAQPASAALTSVVEDPVGDFQSYPGLPASLLPPPGYQDIVRAAITLKDGRFILLMEMAQSVPENPTLPLGIKLLDWSWGLDTNSATNPPGFPFQPSNPRRTEYIVQILWDGTSFIAHIIDRTPLLVGGDAVVTELSFRIKGAELSTSVEAAMIGNPSSFVWTSIARDWETQLGSSGAEKVFDGAPNGVDPWAPWPP